MLDRGRGFACSKRGVRVVRNRLQILIGLAFLLETESDHKRSRSQLDVGENLVLGRDLRQLDMTFVTAIVQRNQLNSFHRCGALQAGRHFPGELIVRPLRGVSKTIKLLFPGPEA